MTVSTIAGTAEEAIRYFSEQAALFSSREAPVDATQVIARLRGYLGAYPKMLDVGCGSGRLVPALVRADLRRYIGVDAAEGRIKIAREKHPKGDFRLGDARALDKVIRPHEKADCFFAIGTFSYMPRAQLGLTLRSIRAVLEDHGIGYLCVMHDDGDEDETVWIDHTVSPEYIPEGYGMCLEKWSKHELNDYLAQAGFRFLGHPDIDDGIISAFVEVDE